AAIDIAKAVTRREHRCSAGKHDIFGERRAIGYARAVVHADVVADGRLKQDILQWFGAFEAQKVCVGESFELRSDVEIRAGIEQQNSGIDKVGLAFILAGTQRWYQAARSGEKYSRSG